MAKLLKKDGNLAELEIVISPEDFNVAIEKAYNKEKSKINVPGFRKGKTPRKIIENYYGEDVFYEDAINEVLPALYEKAIDELGLNTIDRPNVDTSELSKEKGAILNIKVQCEPEVEVSDYKGIKISKINYKISNDDVENELKIYQNRNARVITPDNDYAIKNGDIATIDFDGFIDGIAFDGGKGENHPLTIGSGSFIPGFEDQLIGKKVDDDVEIEVAFPEDYHAKEYAGKNATFKVKIKKIEIRELPELDDDFAQDVSEFDTIEDFKKSIKDKLENDAKIREERDKSDAIIDKIIEKVNVDVPEVMIRDEIANIARRMEHSLAHQGIDFDSYLSIVGMTPEKFIEENRERAINQIKANLAIKKIAELEKIIITAEEINKKIEKISVDAKKTVAEIESAIGRDVVESDLKIEKVIKLLIDNSVEK